MSSTTAIETINIVKKKLEKYTALKEYGKVKEYLHKLHKTSVTPALLQETHVDQLVLQLASHKTAPYRSLAKILWKKWEKRKLLPKSQSKPVETNKPVATIAQADQKSNFDLPEESQSCEEKKPRKVLSLTQYLQSKNRVPSSSTTKTMIAENKLSARDIEVINAQFNATTEKLTVNASDLAVAVNKNLDQSDKSHQHQSDPLKKNRLETKAKLDDDFWGEVDDEDDEEQDFKPQLSSLFKFDPSSIPELW